MKILIGTPSGRNLFSGGFVTSLLPMLAHLKVLGHEAHWIMVGQALVARSRNQLATRAIREEYDVLWMIDDDMVWGKEAVDTTLELLEEKVAIVAVAASKRAYPLSFHVRFIEGSDSDQVVSRISGEGIRTREALTVGTGFMAIETKVLRALANTTNVRAYDDQGVTTARFFYEGEVETKEGRRVFGEDETFVLMARSAGFKTIVPIDVTIGHEGMHVFEGKVSDFADWKSRAKPECVPDPVIVDECD